MINPIRKQECDHHAYEFRCTLCPYVELKTDWIEITKPTGRWACGCTIHTPKDAVEEKIASIRLEYSKQVLNSDNFEKELRDLVRLAR